MQEQRYVSLSTLRRWVQRAREMGLLGPAVPGKAGECPSHDSQAHSPTSAKDAEQ